MNLRMWHIHPCPCELAMSCDHSQLSWHKELFTRLLLFLTHYGHLKGGRMSEWVVCVWVCFCSCPSYNRNLKTSVKKHSHTSEWLLHFFISHTSSLLVVSIAEEKGERQTYTSLQPIIESRLDCKSLLMLRWRRRHRWTQFSPPFYSTSPRLGASDEDYFDQYTLYTFNNLFATCISIYSYFNEQVAVSRAR